MTEAAYVLQLH